MPENAGDPLSFFQELKRRKVIRVITVYAAAAFVILELVDILSPSLGLPTWTLNFILVLLCVGFIIAVIFSWIYDITPEGIEKTKPVEDIKEPEKPTLSVAWKVATYISVVIILAFVVFYVVRTREHSAVIMDVEKSIAVLPFENMSDNSEFAHLGDAMTDEIIMQLYKIHEFEVRSRTSIMQYKDTDKASPLIGEELKVNYLLEGSTQRYEDLVRIRVQLIHASTDDHIWGDIFEGEWKDIFDIQINVAKQVAYELKTVLSPEEIEQIEKNPTYNPEAYNLYLKAHQFQNTRSKEGLAKAIDYYQEAIHLDSNYALAFSGLANSYALQVSYGYVPQLENLSKVKEAAAKSLEIDDKLGQAHLSLGLIGILEGDIYRTEQEFKLSILLNPNNAEAHHWYSIILALLGKTEEAIREAKIALELEPVNPIMMRGLGRVYYYSRQYDLALKELNKCLEIDPGQRSTFSWVFFSYYQNAMYDDAITSLEKDLIIRELEDIAALIRQTYEESGFNMAIRQLLDVSMEKSIGFGSSPRYRSRLFASIGDTDKALEWCEKAYGEGKINNELQVDPIYDNLRSDPRFQDLLERMNFPVN